MLKRGLMQKLLTRGIGHTQFKPTKLGEIPETWNISSIGSLLKGIIDYRGKTPPYSTEGIPVLSAENIGDGEIRSITKYVTPDVYKRWTTRGFPEPEDVLITTEAPVGEVASFPVDGTYLITRRLIALQPKTGLILKRFMKYVLMSTIVQRQLKTKTRGTTVRARILSVQRHNGELRQPLFQCRIHCTTQCLDERAKAISFDFGW